MTSCPRCASLRAQVLPAGPPPITTMGSLKVVLSLESRVALNLQEDFARTLLDDQAKPSVSFDKEFVSGGSTNPVIKAPVGLRSKVRALRRPPLGIALE